MESPTVMESPAVMEWSSEYNCPVPGVELSSKGVELATVHTCVDF